MLRKTSGPIATVCLEECVEEPSLPACSAEGRGSRKRSECTAMRDISSKAPRRKSGPWVEKDGHLYARYSYRDSAGKRRQRWKAIAKKSDAKDAAEQLKKRVEKEASATPPLPDAEVKDP